MGSVQFRMETKVRAGKEDKPDLDYTYILDYKEQGQRFYAKLIANGDQHVSIPGKQVPQGRVAFGDERAFDGVIGRIRRIDEKFLSQSRKRENVDGPQPLPWKVISFFPAQSLEGFLSKGRFAIASVEDVTENGSKLRIVTFNDVKTGRPFFRIAYDLTHGCLPVRAQEFEEDGTLAGEVRGVRICEVHSEGNTYFVPVAGVMEKFQSGRSTYYVKFEVDENTLVLGQKLPQTAFQLQRQPGETVYDSDIQLFVTDPIESSLQDIDKRPTTAAVVPAPASSERKPESVSAQSTNLMAGARVDQSSKPPTPYPLVRPWRNQISYQ